MRIGFIAEGSYPYVSGGVSSWIQMMIEQMPQHEFHIISISDKPKSETDFKYSIPSNVTGITNINLNEGSGKARVGAGFNEEDQSVLRDWMLHGNQDGRELVLLGDKEKIGTAGQFFCSSFFWELMEASYQQESGYKSFIDYLSMWKAKLGPVIHLLQQEFPEVDILHSASTGFAGLVGSYLKIQRGTPFILTEHGIYSREREEEILQSDWISPEFKKNWIDYFYKLSRYAYQNADDVITLFQKNSEFQRLAGAPSEKTSVVPNGISLERFKNVQRTIQGPRLKIGAIVRVVPIKDIKTMIWAASELKESRVPFELVIMGPAEEDEQYAEECRELIRMLNLDEEVCLAGKVDIADRLPEFDVLLLSSISEGQPLALLEGMAAGLPWVATDVGCCRELLFGSKQDKFGQAGFIVPPVNAKAMGDKLKWFYKNPAMRREFGSNGRKRVEAFYQLHQVIETYTTLYEERGKKNGGDRVSSAASIQ
ncbi:DUF3492 domain-containing protein [Rossellomorea vietnamensis]|uniref:DUF3492 domain-containing protein n=1 Tax=Rossellomorea vietnamensis TaxID=218284 RepID=A0A5D4K9M3_9BACI|nr:GT4 family glycosyltransferase PelF [Rossellomorea vietnamensis]TYR73410.1 DUF3492 domain-containing protein [Rossellomorea vietnamensis]